MAETYCGKNCSDCDYKTSTSCPGCRLGPGRSIGGECELARCCREKGHESCDTCSYRGNCGRIFQRDTMAEYRIKKQEREQVMLQARKRKAVFLAPWVNRLFWLFIFANVASLLNMKQLVELVPALKVPGQLLNMAISVGYFLILLKMAQEESQFNTAAWCTLGTGAMNLFFLVILGMEQLPFLISILIIVIGLVGEYNEFHGFADVLFDVDIQLSDKWKNLWNWYFACYVALFGSVLLTVILPILGILVLFAAVIGLAVIGIIQIVYTYRAGKVFQAYTE